MEASSWGVPAIAVVFHVHIGHRGGGVVELPCWIVVTVAAHVGGCWPCTVTGVAMI